MTIVEEIQKLKQEKNAVILAHYYVRPEVQDIADYIGDSFYLSRVATELSESTIVFCGVSFMGESAKILNPDKTVLMPDPTADCPMAHMADVESIKKVRKEYEDVAVVCYINSTAALKEYSDVCVTSANAVKIVKALPNKNIYFIPDRNLAHFVADQVPEKHFIYNEGFCPTHERMEADEVREAKEEHPDALVLSHPECNTEVLKISDYIGSTSGIIKYATESPCNEFIICTEEGVHYKLVQNNPDAPSQLLRVAGGVLQNRLAPAVDGSEGRPQLVGHGGDELGFHLLVLADLEGHIVDVVHQFPQLVRVLVFDLEAIAPGRDPLGRLRHHGHRLHHVVDEQQAGDQHQGHADASHRQNDKDHQDNLPVHQLHGRHQPHDARHPAVEQQGR